MTLLKLIFIIASALMIKPALSAQVADVIFFNGAIYKVDAARSWADAVVISENRIAFVGGNDEALKQRSESTRVVNLEGRMMLPGFHDVHVHPIASRIGLPAPGDACQFDAADWLPLGGSGSV